MNYSYILKKQLMSLNNGSLEAELICKPTPQQLKELKRGSGHPEKEIKQVNSSAGLAVNYWRAYELCHNKSSVEFEWKKQVPLRRGRRANVDVVVRENNVINFIESKFLEPYYSNNEIPRESYLDSSKYSTYTKDFPDSWVSLFDKASKYEYYNVTQLSRHLLAISKDIWANPNLYHNKEIRFISITWEMPDSFLHLLPSEIAKEFEQRRKKIEVEANKSVYLFNSFIKKHLHFKNFEYLTLTYNEIIKDIRNNKYLSQLKQRYFL